MLDMTQSLLIFIYMEVTTINFIYRNFQSTMEYWYLCYRTVIISFISNVLSLNNMRLSQNWHDDNHNVCLFSCQKLKTFLFCAISIFSPFKNCFRDSGVMHKQINTYWLLNIHIYKVYSKFLTYNQKWGEFMWIKHYF